MFDVATAHPMPELWDGLVGCVQYIVRPFMDRFGIGVLVVILTAGVAGYAFLGWIVQRGRS